MNELTIDFNDYDSLLKLMDDHKQYECTLIGRTADDELTFTTILEDSVTVRTYQTNKWIRENTFWRDGTTEETFDGRWEE